MENLIVSLLSLYSFVLIARALMSWFRIGPDSPMYSAARVIHQVTEPVLAPIRSVLPQTGSFDFSIFVAIIGLNLLVIPLVRAIIPG